MSRRTVTLFAFLSLAAAACTPERGPIGHLKVPGERGTEYRIGPDSISNERLSVSRVEGGKVFRGLVNGNLEIEIRVEGNQLKGERAGTPIAIQVAKKGNEIVAQGFYGGKATSVHILQEPQGLCAFRYDEKEGAGPSTCANQPSLALPPFMATWSPEEQALFVAIALTEVYQGPTQALPGAPGYGVKPSLGAH